MNEFSFKTVEWLILAESKRNQSLLPLDSWWLMLSAGVCLVVVIWGVVRLVTQVNDDADPAETDRQMLLVISDLKREGDLSDHEYRSIKSQLVERIAKTDSRFPPESKAAESAGQPGKQLSQNETSVTEQTAQSESADEHDRDKDSGDRSVQPS
ncbi:MAG: hypothetical protein KDA85_13385 [Planctomycetaceae bacterium]|nr:hypothetical protein [Planctomycetaceae bacterium]